VSYKVTDFVPLKAAVPLVVSELDEAINDSARESARRGDQRTRDLDSRIPSLFFCLRDGSGLLLLDVFCPFGEGCTVL